MSYGGDPVEGDEGLLHLVTSSTFLDLGDQTHSHSESDLNPVKLIPILFFFFFSTTVESTGVVLMLYEAPRCA